MDGIRWWIVGLGILVGAGLAACSPESSAPEKIQPVYLEPLEGTDLKRLTLTERAAERLDIQTAIVTEQVLVRTRVFGGEIVGSPDVSDIWVRVLLSDSDLEKVDRREAARVMALGGDEQDASWSAEADKGPATEEAGQGLFYLLHRAGTGLSAGEPVLVELSMLGSGGPQKVIPFAAVIYQTDGSTWVYSNPEPLVFLRQPIVIDYVEGDLAVLSEGPDAGTAVVTVGVAELFGAETGVSK
jgi:hypothetical protein